jgi:hypothetical protein
MSCLGSRVNQFGILRFKETFRFCLALILRVVVVDICGVDDVFVDEENCC